MKSQGKSGRKSKAAHNGRILKIVGDIPEINGRADRDSGRRVYLVRVEGPARAGELYASMSLPDARNLASWALSLGIPVECEPPGCLRETYDWPLPGWRPERIFKLPPV